MKSFEQIKNKVKKQNNTEGRDDIGKFMELFDQACIDERGPGRATTKFYPSSLGLAAGKCQRRYVYLFRGVEPENTTSAQGTRIMGLGTKIHEQLQATIKLMGVELKEEVRIESDDPPIGGYVDGVITLPWNNKKIVIEIKSINENGFIIRKKWNKAKDEHFAQANLYAHMLGIDTVWVIYLNKNNSEMEIYERGVNTKAAEKLLATWKNTWKMYKDGDLPVRPYKIGSQTCEWCDFKKFCNSDPEIGV